MIIFAGVRAAVKMVLKDYQQMQEGGGGVCKFTLLSDSFSLFSSDIISLC